MRSFPVKEGKGLRAHDVHAQEDGSAAQPPEPLADPVSWFDDERHPHWAWIPAANFRRVTDSEWDIKEYRSRPEHMRGIRWGDRLPGFLPAQAGHP